MHRCFITTCFFIFHLATASTSQAYQKFWQSESRPHICEAHKKDPPVVCHVQTVDASLCSEHTHEYRADGRPQEVTKHACRLKRSGTGYQNQQEEEEKTSKKFSCRFHISTRFWVVYVLKRASDPHGGPLVFTSSFQAPWSILSRKTASVTGGQRINSKQRSMNKEPRRTPWCADWDCDFSLYVRGRCTSPLVPGGMIQCADWTVS